MASLNLHGGVSSRGEPFDVKAAIRQLDAAVICLQETWLPASRDGPPGQAVRSADPDPSADAMAVAGRASADRRGPGQYGSRRSGAEAQPGWHSDHIAAAAVELGAAVYRAPLGEGPSLASFGIPAESGPGQLSIAVLTTVAVTSYEVVELGQIAGDNVPRLAQVILLELPGRPALRLVNTHLTHRLASPLQLYRLWRHLDAEPLPTIIAGDLNMPRFLASRLPGYFAVVNGRTWPADQPLVQLDHVLVSQDIGGMDGAVLPATGSDHLPIRAHLWLRLSGAF